MQKVYLTIYILLAAARGTQHVSELQKYALVSRHFNKQYRCSSWDKQFLRQLFCSLLVSNVRLVPRYTQKCVNSYLSIN